MQTSQRNTYPIHFEAAPDISKSVYNCKLQDQEEQSYDTANKKYVRHPCTGEGGDQSQLSIHILPSSENRRIVSPHLQPETIKQFCQAKGFSTFQSLSNAKFFTERRLDGKGGSESGIFPPAYSQGAQTIPQAQLQWSAPPNDLPSLRPFISATDIHLSNELDCRIPKKPQYKVCGISGRFFAGESVLASFTRTHYIYGESNATTGLDSQHGQICTGSDTTPGISGRHMGHQTQHEVPVGTEVPNATQGTSQSDEERKLVSQTSSVPFGQTQLRIVCSTQREVTLSNPAVSQSSPSQAASLQTDQTTRTCTSRNELVVRSSAGLTSNTYRADLAPAHYGCIGLRLGRSARRHENVRSVDDTTTVVACQSQGAVCGLCGNSTRRQSAAQCSHPLANRQPHSRSLYQQGRWYEVQETSGSDTPTVEGNGPVKYIPDSAVLSGSIQLRSRRPIARQDMSRMAPNICSNERDIPDVGNTTGRLIRFKDSSCSDAVCVIGHTRSRGNISQRVPSPMGLRTSMVVPTTKLNTPGTVSAKQCRRPVHPDRSEVEDGILARGPTSPSHSRPVPHTGPSTSSDRHEDRNTSARDSRHSFRSLADFGWTDEIKNWSVGEKTLLLSSWRNSTLNTYIPAWNKWKAWCVSNKVTYKNPCPEQVARYLAYLHSSEGLAYRTILVHKSVIATFANLSENLSSNFLVKHILKAISVSKEKKMKPPIWNAKNVIEYLKNNAPDHNNLYQVSRRTAMLLLLAAGRRVHDLTLLRIDADKFVQEENDIVLWPCFGSKTDDIGHRQSGWRLKVHPNKNLDCVYWTRQLIRTSQDRRKSGNLTELFITARGEPKPASRTVIGGWIKSVLKDAGVEASPGSVRSAVASLNWLEKFPIDKILETGNWRQEHTFRTYYQKEIADLSNNNDLISSVSLSNFFEPVR